MENKYAFIIALFTIILGLPNALFGQCDFDIDNTLTTDATCGQADGAVEFSLSGGISPYTLDWSGGSEMSNIIIGMASGIYDVTITDGTPCSEVVQVVIDETDSPTIDAIIPTNATCGNSDGSVQVIISGGAAPYQVTIGGDTATGNSPVTIPNLPPGIHSVDVADSNGCFTTGTVTIGEDAGPQIDNITTSNSTCGNSDGSIEVFINGGTPDYTVEINGQLATGSSPVTVTGLSSGTYNLIVTDSNGCTDTGSVTISENGSPVIDDVSTTDATCGNADGSVTITVSGGQSPYEYNFDGVSSSNGTFTDLLAGTYTISVVDANGCSVSITVTIFDANGLTIDDVSTTDATCGNADGSVTIIASGGQPPYEYSIDGGPFQLNEIFTNLPQGTYVILIQDANGCVADGVAFIQEESGPSIVNIEVTDESCSNQDGAVQINVNGGTSPYTFSLNNGQTQSNNIFTNLSIGTYEIIVADANGCAASATFIINDVNNLSSSITNINHPCGQGDGIIVVSAMNGVSPFNYNVNGTIFNNGNITNLSAGVYDIIVTDAVGCTAEETVTLIDELEFSCFISGDTVMDCTDPGTVLTIVCPNSPPNFVPQWVNNPSANGPFLTVATPGIYSTTIERCDGSMDFLEVEVVFDPEIQCGTIQGQVTIDDNDNCTFDPDEVPFAGYLVQAVGDQTFFGFTDANGEYTIPTTTGNYEVSILNYDENLWLPCVASETVTVVANDIAIADFSIEKVIDCPLMEVQIATPLVRRCFNGYYTVSYCNNGTVDATDVSIVVTLPEFMTIFDAPPYTDNGDNTYKFEIEDVDFGDCGSFIIQVYTSCDAMLGQTLCASAEIFPQDPCEPVNPSWSGASLEITATCDGSQVQYLITNVGTGDMITTTEYIVIEDGVMFPPVSDELQLDAGQSMPINLPANGSTYLLQVNQVEGHPGNSNPTLAVEACGVNFAGIFTTGFVNQFPFDDEDDFIDIDCHEVIGSYDPNDKQAFPMGYGDEHYITDSTEIDYLIRFQNTGTDTAFNIVVEDVLSEHLDITTFHPGVSSHPYHVDIFGSDTIHFVFENILLPDSNINEPLSHGFVQFSIEPRTGLPLETVVENYADIFFDFNEAIRTNTVFHTVGEDFIIISKDHEAFIPNLEIQVVPNPFSDQTRLTLKGVETQDAVLHLYNLQGQKMATQAFNNSSVLIKRNGLLSGMYFYKIEIKGQLGGTGKLIIQ